MWRDLERTCGRLGLPFRRPSVFPRNGLHAARIACHHRDEPWLPAFARGVYRANFAEDRDIASPAVLREVLECAAAPAEAALAAAEAPEAKERLRSQTEHAVALGVFGAPTLRAAGELFWGNDRLEEALDWARRAGADPALPRGQEAEGLQLTIETAPQAKDVDALAAGLNEHAIPTTGVAGFQPLAVFARDRSGSLVGGAFGQVNWNWLFVSLFWVSAAHRCAGLGSRILATLEAAARERGCANAHLDTFSYQARPFYERHGYSLFATLEDYPPGQRRHFMRKALGLRSGA